MAKKQSELDKIRDKMRKKNGRGRDPHEWRPKKAEGSEELKWRFFFLPPMDNMDLWYYEHGAHYIDGKRLECPRLHDEEDCPLCDYAFGLMKKTDDKEERRQIARKLLPSSRYAVNIYFPAYKSTPEDLRGKIFWFSMPQTIYNICERVIFRDGPGDGPEPEPYGVFWEPTSAYPFTLEAYRKGDYNSYESSRFSSKPVPITQKGQSKIEEILGARHDVPSKFDARDLDALQAIADRLGQNDDGDYDTVDEEPESKPKPKRDKAKTKPTLKPDEEEIETDTISEDKAETETEPEVESEPETEEAESETEEAEPETEEKQGSDSGGDESADPELQALLKKLG